MLERFVEAEVRWQFVDRQSAEFLQLGKPARLLAQAFALELGRRVSCVLGDLIVFVELRARRRNFSQAGALLRNLADSFRNLVLRDGSEVLDALNEGVDLSRGLRRLWKLRIGDVNVGLRFIKAILIIAVIKRVVIVPKLVEAVRMLT